MCLSRQSTSGALSIPVIAGRSFGLSDAAGSQPVIIINEEAARTYFKGQRTQCRPSTFGSVRRLGPGF